jgi:hypothetical protein
MRIRRCCSGCRKWELRDDRGAICRQPSLVELFHEFIRLRRMGILP